RGRDHRSRAHHSFPTRRSADLRPEQVHVVMGDTKTCPDTGIAAGSRSHIMYGLACINGCNKLMDAMRKADGSFRTYDEMKNEGRSEEHTSELQSRFDLVCRLLL